MINPQTAAPALAIVLAVLPALAAPFESRFLRSNPSTAGKLAYYAFTIAFLWVLTAVAVWLFGIERLRDAPLHRTEWLPRAAVVGPILGVFVTAYFVLALMPLFQSLRGPRLRRAYAKAYRRHAENFAGLLPNSAVERLGFVLLSLTAGVCEEALYRGFLIRYLHESALALPVLQATAAAAFFFGLGHLYQGASALLRTGLAGALLGLLFLLSGSLIPGIILHALVDLQGAYILRPFPDEGAVVT